MHITLLDNFDSFAYNLVEQLCLLGAGVRVMRNDISLPTVQAALLANSCELLVLLPGFGRPENAGCMLESLAWTRGCLPVLGVYFGHQALALAAGSAVGEVRKPLHGKSTSLRFGQHHPPFDDIADLRVTHYYSLVVSRLLEGFGCLADADGKITVMADPYNRQLSLQSHSELVLTIYGQCPLENALFWYGTLAVRERLRA